jgi:hypothetical protein
MPKQLSMILDIIWIPLPSLSLSLSPSLSLSIYHNIAAHNAGKGDIKFSHSLATAAKL